MYKKAAQLQLRFSSSKGELNVEQVFKLSTSSIKGMLIAQSEVIQKQTGKSAELSFLEDNNKVDEKDQLRFDILKDIYITKMNEAKAVSDEKTRKEQLNKLLAIKAARDEERLKTMSDADLDAQIAALSK